MPSALSLPFFLQIMISIFTRAQIYSSWSKINIMSCFANNTHKMYIHKLTDGSSISLKKKSTYTIFKWFKTCPYGHTLPAICRCCQIFKCIYGKATQRVNRYWQSIYRRLLTSIELNDLIVCKRRRFLSSICACMT